MCFVLQMKEEKKTKTKNIFMIVSNSIVLQCSKKWSEYHATSTACSFKWYALRYTFCYEVEIALNLGISVLIYNIHIRFGVFFILYLVHEMNAYHYNYKRTLIYLVASCLCVFVIIISPESSVMTFFLASLPLLPQLMFNNDYIWILINID